MRNTILKSVQIPNGETIGYRYRKGGDRVLVLVHGNLTSSKHWDVLIEAMPNEYSIYAIDLRGFGISSYNRPIESLKDFSNDLKELVDVLKLIDFYLVGWSTGGGVAMHFTADYPDYVRKLILIESVGISGFPFFKKDKSGQPIFTQLLKTKEEIASDPIQVVPALRAFEEKNREFFRTLWNLSIYNKNKPDSEKYEEYIDDMFTQRNLVDVDYSLAIFNISNKHNGVCEGTGDIYKINCPTLVFQGENDIVVPRTMAEGIIEAIGENAKLIMLPSGHSPLIDCLDILVKEIVNFTK